MVDLRKLFFKYRGFTPIPLILIVIIFARPTWISILAGLLIMIVGEVIRIWGVSHAGGATRTRNVGAPQLVTSGPFSHVRNPLYIGNMLMYTGAAAMADIWLPWLFIIVWLFFGVQYLLIVRLEEEELERIFGNEYLEYKKNVPAFIPSFSAYAKESARKPDFRMAFRSEKSTFISFAVIILLMLGKMWFF